VPAVRDSHEEMRGMHVSVELMRNVAASSTMRDPDKSELRLPAPSII
jgi:hypothetical protein